VSVPRLARLAAVYEVPVDLLLPADDDDGGGRGKGSGEKIAIDLTRLSELDGPSFEMLSRYLRMIQEARGDFNGKVLTIRGDDLRAVAAMFGLSQAQVLRKLEAWGLRYRPG
jgi:ABC-type transporter Mla MlaB component